MVQTWSFRFLRMTTYYFMFMYGSLYIITIKKVLIEKPSWCSDIHFFTSIQRIVYLLQTITLQTWHEMKYSMFKHRQLGQSKRVNRKIIRAIFPSICIVVAQDFSIHICMSIRIQFSLRRQKPDRQFFKRKKISIPS